MIVKIDEGKCPKNHPCPAVKICPALALSQVDFNAPKVDVTKCIGCGKCVRICGKKALYFEN